MPCNKVVGPSDRLNSTKRSTSLPDFLTGSRHLVAGRQTMKLRLETPGEIRGTGKTHFKCHVCDITEFGFQ